MSISEEEIAVSFSDLRKIFFMRKRSLKKVALCTGFSIALVFLFFQEPVYLAKASFRSTADKEEQQFDLKNLVKSVLSSSQENFTLSVMESDVLLHQVVQKMGLQAKMKSENIFTRIYGNLAAEIGLSLPRKDPFIFKEVVYEKEKPLALYLIFSTPDSFELLNHKKQLLAKAHLQEKVVFSKGEFVLEKAPKNLKLAKLYPLSLQPWPKITQDLRKRLEVQHAKTDGNLLTLKFSDRDRYLSAQFLNELMQGFRQFLKKENEEIVAAQIDYLGQRQKELGMALDGHLNEYELYLKSKLGESGFIGFEQEVAILAGPKERYLSRLFEIDLELKKLQTMQGAKGLFDPLSKNNQTVIIENIPIISLQGVQDVFQNVQQELSHVYGQIKQFLFIRKQMEEPDFELSSLSDLLQDPSTRLILNKAVDLSLQLNDSANRSIKEMERIKETAAVQKRALSAHFEQTVALLEVQAKVLEDKTASLQHAAINFLKLEKQLTEQKLLEMSYKMRDLPERWKLENQLKLKKELSLNMIQGVANLVETKNVHQHLFQISSKPLDKALPPLKAKRSHFFFFSLLGALASACSLYTFHLFRGLYAGLPVTYEKIKKSTAVFGGKLSLGCATSLSKVAENDLETLRRVSLFTNSCTSIIGGKNPNFSHALAELLSLKGQKILLIECAFDRVVPLEDVPGLWHYLMGKMDSCLIRRKNTYDYIPTGGVARHGTEMLTKENFLTLLSEYKKQYDTILLYSTAVPFSTEAHTYMKYADKLIVCTSDEPFQELQEYISWSKPQEKLLFVYFE